MRPFPLSEWKPNGRGDYKKATHTRWRDFNQRLHKSESISYHTVCMTRDLKILNFPTVLGEAALYDRFNAQTTVSQVSDIDNHESYGNIMTVLTVVVHDKTGFPTIIVSSQLTNDTADGKSY